MGTIKYTEMEVTPALAKRWLEKNSDQQRPVSWSRVEAFAADMRNGEWKLTHQAIAFDADNTLIDGQHRLQAVVMSGKSVRMVVATNPEADFSDPIDRGTPRSINQILGMSSRRQAALNTLRMLEQGYYITAPLTVAQAVEIQEHHEKSLNALQASKLRGPVLGACAWAYPCAPDRVRAFVDRVERGEMIQRGDPEFALRNWLQGRPLTRGAVSWIVAMASLNAIRYACANLALASIFAGESGYRTITTQRRVLKVPYTPEASLVQGLTTSPAMAKRNQKKVAPVETKNDNSWAALSESEKGEPSEGGVAHEKGRRRIHRARPRNCPAKQDAPSHPFTGRSCRSDHGAERSGSERQRHHGCLSAPRFSTVV